MASAGRARIRWRTARRRVITGSPQAPDSYRGEAWASQVPGSSSCAVPWSYAPPGAAATRPAAQQPPSPSRSENRSAPGLIKFSGLHSPRPIRSRDYASPDPLPGPAQASLPAGRARPFAGRVSHPLDGLPNFMSSSHLTPFGPAFPCRTGRPTPICSASSRTRARRRTGLQPPRKHRRPGRNLRMTSARRYKCRCSRPLVRRPRTFGPRPGMGR